MTDKKKNVIRYRLNVPIKDESTCEWLAAQTDISTSIRQLIHADIEKNGYTDALCISVEQLPKRGRPVGTAKESMQEEPVAKHVANEVPNAIEQSVVEVRQTETPRPNIMMNPTQLSIDNTIQPVSPSMSLLDDLGRK